MSPSGVYPRRVKPPVERFWAKVEKRGEDECWGWNASTATFGYGVFWPGSSRADSRVTYAHRYSYELHHGEIPPGLVVMHACDNPPCVNPGHLSVGTHADNVRDKIQKGRQPVVPLQPCCRNGHEYTPENTRFHKGGRECRTCAHLAYRARRVRKQHEGAVA